MTAEALDRPTLSIPSCSCDDCVAIRAREAAEFAAEVPEVAEPTTEATTASELADQTARIEELVREVRLARNALVYLKDRHRDDIVEGMQDETICIPGGNEALRELGLDEWEEEEEEYEYSARVTVTFNVSVTTTDTDSAYELAEELVRDNLRSARIYDYDEIEVVDVEQDDY